MIVASRFLGDDHIDLQWRQHDLYGRALSILIDEAKDRLRRAEALVGPSALGDTVRRGAFDHRRLQDAHDLLAALWRASHGYLQPELEAPGLGLEARVAEWLPWLRSYVGGMSDDLIRAVLIIGYSEVADDDTAETNLVAELSDRLRRQVVGLA